VSFFFRLRLLGLLLRVRSALRRRPRTCVRGRYIGHVFAAACVNRKPVRVRADDSRWPVQRAHRFHGAPETHWLIGSIVHAARQFGMAKHRFARVAIDLSHALFSTVVSKHGSRNPITSASHAYFGFTRFHRSSSIPSVSSHQCREAFASLWRCRKLKECQCSYRSQSACVVRLTDRRGTANLSRSDEICEGRLPDRHETVADGDASFRALALVDKS
jgi:hypothetical protein